MTAFAELEADFQRHDDELGGRGVLETDSVCARRAAVTLLGATALVLSAAALQQTAIRWIPFAWEASVDIGTCVQPGRLLPDCDRLDAGSCGVACCTVETAVPNLDPADAYTALRRALVNGGPDGRYSKDSSDEDDAKLEVPFAFSPPLPWRFTMSGRHSTSGAFASSGVWRDGFEDMLRFSVGVATDFAHASALTRVRLHSMSGPNGVLVDFGQNYKTLALLCEHLGWPKPSPLHGCGIGQATGWRPANATTVALQNRDGVCLDAKQRGISGGLVQMWSCDPSNLNQLWNIDASTGLIKNHDGVCLDASDRNTEAAAVVTWACDPTSRNQQWRFDPATGQIRAGAGDGLCLDATDRKTNGGRVLMWGCDVDNKNQQWVARAVEGTLGTLPL